jgi:hypothetical protein
MPKNALYAELFHRMNDANKHGRWIEASWYAYSLLEDRLLSLLRSSGGEGKGGAGKPLRMVGPKLKELQYRSKKDELLRANFAHDDIDAWKEERNNLMHAMAYGSMTIGDIDVAAERLAGDGVKLVASVAAACRRVKKHRSKVTA